MISSAAGKGVSKLQILGLGSNQPSRPSLDVDTHTTASATYAETESAIHVCMSCPLHCSLGLTTDAARGIDISYWPLVGNEAAE